MRNKFTIVCICTSLLINNLLDAQCFKKISTIWDTNIALNMDGTIWEWGSNNSFQLGLGMSNSQHRNIPFQLTTSNDWKNVVSSYNSNMSQKNDGTIWAWGNGGNGIFGNGTSGVSNYIFVPTQVGNIPYTNLFSTMTASFGIKSNGTLWGWGGENYNGQVGVGTNPNLILVPTQVGTNANWSFVGGNLYYVIALKIDGTLWAWGANSGLFGNGTTQDSNIPVQIGSENNWKEVSTSAGHTLALKTDGTLWSWGNNQYGQIGDGTTIAKTIPVQIGTQNNWRQAKISSDNSFAIKNDGSLWAWGRNEGGRLGDGTTQQKLSPVQIGNSNEWKDIECGGSHCVARKQDNSIWTWGYNNRGQLGNGTFISNFIPSMIVGPCSVLSTENNMILSNDAKLYPNPVSDNLNFSREIKNLKIYSLDGRMIKEIYNVNNQKINLSSIDLGTYLVEALTIDGKIIKGKIIKSNKLLFYNLKN